MGRSSLVGAVILALSAGCSGTSTDDQEPSGGQPSGGKTSAAGAPSEPMAGSSAGVSPSGGDGAASAGGAGSTTAEPLTDHELFLVGVWRGTVSVDDQQYSYFVLQPDRTGCGWDRHGTNFGQRYFEYAFADWQLEESPLDEKGRMTLRFRASSGDEQAIERYDPETDRIFVGGNQATSWLDLLIPCDSVGTNATETEVMRQGSKP